MNSGQVKLLGIFRAAVLVCVCGLNLQCYAQDQQADQPAQAPPSATAETESKPLIQSVAGERGAEHPGTSDDSSSRDKNQSKTATPDAPEESATVERSVKVQSPSRSDFNQDIYYRNKLEFALDAGYLPINIPFPFNVFEGDPYDLYPLRYTLVPVVVSIRWHIDNVGSRWIFRGNWDMTASFSATAIPRGAETHYFSYDMGVRRNFVRRNSRIAPYTDMRLGLGIIDAKGPLGVYYAQGQNYTFTANLGAGVRYNFNPRYGISAGLNWMHISNNNLSAPEYSNYGINVYGPQFGLNVQLGHGRRHASE
jgi:Lipid A 3-O-deacylase (PagL)